jgi:hypothetical protein
MIGLKALRLHARSATELVGCLAGENDACRGRPYSAYTQTLRGPCVAGVGRTIRPGGGVEDAPRLWSCRKAARRPIARLFERAHRWFDSRLSPAVDRSTSNTCPLALESRGGRYSGVTRSTVGRFEDPAASPGMHEGPIGGGAPYGPPCRIEDASRSAAAIIPDRAARSA